MITKNPLLIAFLSLCTLSCSNRNSDDLIPNIPNEDIVTYDNTVASIISDNCISCHSNPPQFGATFPLTTYLDVKNFTEDGQLLMSINDASDPMPPSGLMPQFKRDLIQEWADNGFPEN